MTAHSRTLTAHSRTLTAHSRTLTAYIETYGCTANKADSEIMEAILMKEGFTLAKTPSKADVIILNTCAVKSRTELHMVKLIKKYRNRNLVVAGCLGQAKLRMVRKLAPKAPVLSPSKIHRIAQAIKGRSFKGLKSPDKSRLPQRHKGLVAKILISEGCLGSCSYCMTRLARGKLRSFSRRRIVSNVSEAVANGAKEIWLTSQDCAVYGLDRKDSLSNLLNQVTSVRGDFMVRVGMSNPSFLQKSIGAFSSPKIFKFFHIPVQSGSDRVLKHMRRGYRAEDFVTLVSEIRKKFPTAYISTDIIAGYPTETEDDWRATVELVGKTKPEIINISSFSPREGTPAAEMDQIVSRVVKERTREMTRIHKEITRKANKRLVGKEFDVLADEKTKKGLMGRTRDYRPVGLKKGKIGKWRKVRISSSTDSYLLE